MALVPIVLMLTTVVNSISNSVNLTHTNVVACCRSLANEYKGLVLYPDDERYAVWDDRWTNSATLGPRCIFTPTSAEQLSIAVKTFATAAGGEGLCPFAICSGGGMAWAGANDIHEGITLDLRLLNTTVISKDRTYVSIGSGTTWEHVYDSLNGSNLAIPGGRNQVFGVSGFALGGGFSWLTPRVGWAVDNVINFEIVLASGDICNVNNTNDYDLFMALKGGGNNFGVVTRVDIAAIEHDQKIYGGEISMSSFHSSDLALLCLNRFMEISLSDSDTYASVRYKFHNASDGSSNSYSVVAEFAALDDKEDHLGLDCFQALASGPILSDWTGHTTFSEFRNSAVQLGRTLPATATFKPFTRHENVINGIQQISTAIYYNSTHIAGLMWDIEYQPLGLNYLDVGQRRGGNVMGLNYTGESLMMVHLTASWDRAEDDGDAANAVEQWLSNVQEYTNVINASYPFLSPNYAGPSQNPLASYGVHNFAFLQDVAKKYDPDGLFQDAVPGGFKLKNAAP